jgi:hypothetical protein
MLGGSSKVAPQPVMSPDDTIHAAFSSLASGGVVTSGDLPTLCASLGNVLEQSDLDGEHLHYCVSHD